MGSVDFIRNIIETSYSYLQEYLKGLRKSMVKKYFDQITCPEKSGKLKLPGRSGKSNKLP